MRTGDFLLQNITVHWRDAPVSLSLLSHDADSGTCPASSGERILFDRMQYDV